VFVCKKATAAKMIIHRVALVWSAYPTTAIVDKILSATFQLRLQHQHQHLKNPHLHQPQLQRSQHHHAVFAVFAMLKVLFAAIIVVVLVVVYVILSFVFHIDVGVHIS